MKRDIAFVFFLLLSLSWSMAQPYAVKRLGIEQGLSNNYVIGITQDKQGFLWFATEEGLNKFDGTRFITYYKNDPSQSNQGLTGNELNRIYADPNLPVIWIATQRDGLNAYNYRSQTFTAYQNDPKKPHSLITNDVTDIIPSKQKTNGLWVCTYYRGIDYLDPSTGQFTHYNKSTIPALNNEQTWTALDSEDGNLYIGHVNAGLSILSLKDRSVRNFQHEPGNRTSLPGNEVRSILKDSNGNIWVGTDGGLALFNTTTQEFITFKQNPNDKYGTLSSRIFSIKQLSDNKLWIASELNGIAILDLKQSLFLSPQQLTFEYLQEGDNNRSLSSASVRYVFQDSFNNIWIGTWGGGINFISNESPLFTTYTYSSIPNTENCLNNKTVSSICTDNKGRLWIGTDGGGINVFENGKRTAIYNKENSEIQSNFVLSAFRDSKGNLWFGTFQGGISYFSSKTNSFHPVYPMNRSYLDVRTFYEDKLHNIWVGCSEGIYVFNPDNMEVIHHYHTGNSELRGNFVRSITQDEKGRFWIGTFGDGIGVYTPDFRLIKSFVQRDGFCSNTINYIYQDSRKQMWIATGEGLVCFPSMQTFTYKTYQRKEGLGNTFVQAITEDKKGNIWLSTNKGMSCYISDKDCFYNYGHSDDVPAGNFMSGSVARNEQSGMIYFGSINGICCFNPNTMMSELNIPPVVITEMKIFERLGNQENDETFVSLSEGNEVELTHAQNTFSLTFNVQNYSLVNQVEYAYMLKGLENSWYTVKESNSVTFRNMPPGKYEFLIKARIHNQEWPEEATSLIIRINPPLWLTWWAKLAYILITISIIYLILHAYKKKVDLESLYTLEKKNHEQEQELNQERLRFYTNITHELRTPLTLILGPLEDMQKDASLPAKQTQKLSVIHQSALRLLNLINQILEFRKTETQNKKLCVCKGNIAPVIYETELKYKELNRNPKLNFLIKIEKEDLSLFFDKEIVTIILDNLISNAIKYTEQGQITLSVYRTIRNEVSYTEIIVSDTGYGISAEALPHIFDRYYQENCKHQASGTGIGLALVKNLVELHEGEIRVESTKHEGSTFYISLLTDNIYPNALHADSSEPKAEEIEKETPAESLETLTDSGKPILLVVEDNEEIRNYIAESFSDSFEVITAANGKEGKQQAMNRIPDIIVSDIMMPVMDGISLCRQLKEDISTSHIPIILLTAKDSLQNKEEGYEVGADSYLTKPFSASLLRSRINNLLDSRKKLTAQFQSQTPAVNSSGFSEKRTAITEALSRIDNEFIERITLLIEENLSSEKIDINYLSDKMCMSGSTLYRKMKALTGLSTNEYTRKVKMQNAERLLLEGKYNISEIAYKVGMNSTGYFRQCFKEEFGISPSDYLRQVRE